MPRSRVGGLVALVCLTVAAVQATELVNLTTLTRDGQVLVSFELTGAFTEDVRSTIESGLQMTFQYDVELTREAAFWPDSTIASATLATAVRFDNLTEQYNVVRTLDGRVEDTMVVDDEGEVRAMLTRFDQIPLFSTDALEPNGAYQVRVNLEMRPRNAWFVWPWTRSAASVLTHFTFLP